MYNDLWRTLPAKAQSGKPDPHAERRRALLELPQENILYFLEKAAPRLQPWQREILRIVRHVAQYFYPQRQTKVMNELRHLQPLPDHDPAVGDRADQ